MDLPQSTIAPRPIGLVSTIDKDDNPNLALFSYFNLFSASPLENYFADIPGNV
jgi:flavin reductase (DIM6/NTAB) family NADH-FMN oxidoreductase RutF